MECCSNTVFLKKGVGGWFQKGRGEVFDKRGRGFFFGFYSFFLLDLVDSLNHLILLISVNLVAVLRLILLFLLILLFPVLLGVFVVLFKACCPKVFSVVSDSFSQLFPFHALDL